MSQNSKVKFLPCPPARCLEFFSLQISTRLEQFMLYSAYLSSTATNNPSRRMPILCQRFSFPWRSPSFKFPMTPVNWRSLWNNSLKNFSHQNLSVSVWVSLLSIRSSAASRYACRRHDAAYGSRLWGFLTFCPCLKGVSVSNNLIRN